MSLKRMEEGEGMSSLAECCCYRFWQFPMQIIANLVVFSLTLHPAAPLCLVPLKPKNPLVTSFQRMKSSLAFCRVRCFATQGWGEALGLNLYFAVYSKQV